METERSGARDKHGPDPRANEFRAVGAAATGTRQARCEHARRALRRLPSRRTAVSYGVVVADSGMLTSTPNLAVTGFRGIGRFRALLRAKGDAITGIIRADSASVKSIQLSRLAHPTFSDDSQQVARLPM